MFVKRASRLILGLSLLFGAGACRPEEPTVAPDTTVEHKEPRAKDAGDWLAASALPETVDKPLAGDDMGVTVHRLQNGMTVYISTDRQKPRVSAWIGVRTGSFNDPANSTGLAHYLEHMLFKGTDKYGTLDYDKEKVHLDEIAAAYAELRAPGGEAKKDEIFKRIDAATQAASKFSVPNELGRMYAAMGVEGLNAFTSDEVTAYIADIPANRIEAWATVESGRFYAPVFRMFYPELEAVYEEKNLSLDSPENRVYETLRLALFAEHPYGTQPTIGKVEHLKLPAYNDMVQYYRDWYVPNNMAVFLAGDIDAKTALPTLERTLGALEPGPVPERVLSSKPPLSGKHTKEVIAEGEETVTLAFRTVKSSHEDEPVLAVLDRLLDDAHSGLLNLELELTQKVPDASSWNDHLYEAGYMVVEATLKEGQTHAQVEALLFSVIDKLQKGDFTQSQVDAVVLQKQLSDKRRFESNGGRASKMLNSYINRRSWKEVLERDEKMRKVTKKQLVDAARDYLGRDYVAVYRKRGTPERPKIEKPKITPVKIFSARKSKYAKWIAERPARELQPEWLVKGEHYEDAKLPGGPLIASKNPRNDLFSLEYRFDRGHRKDKLLCVALDLLEASGAGKLSADALQKKLYALGTQVNFSCGADSSRIRITGVDKNLKASVKLVDEWFHKPKFKKSTVEKLRDKIVSQRHDQMADPRFLGRALTDYANYGTDSGLLKQPSNAQVKRASGLQLKGLLAKYLDHTHRTLYFGQRSAAAAAKVVALGAKHKDPGTPHLRRYRAGKGVTIYVLDQKISKSTVSLSIPEGQQPRERKPGARYLAHYFGGSMSSLIFQEIREARGLAYYAYGTVSTGWLPEDDWAFVGGMGTQADKTAEALKVYLELLKRPLDKARAADAGIELAEDYRSSRIDPRWVAGQVDTWNRQGEKDDPRLWEWQELAKISHEQLQAVASGYGDLPIAIGIVGDTSKMDMDALKKLGHVVVVDPKKITSFGK
jgi:predicted Zn-dependent peptidase